MVGIGRRCDREKPRLAAATSGAVRDRHRQSQCLRVMQRSTAVCAEAKNTKSLAARASTCGPGSQPIPRANAVWNIAGMVMLGDVAARDVQAATSPAFRIAPAKTKSWRFAGGVLGGGGENTTRQRPSFCMAFRVGNWRSANSRRCGREKQRLTAATSLAAPDRHWQSQCLRVLQRSTAVCAAAKNSKSLAARGSGYGAGSQPMRQSTVVLALLSSMTSDCPQWLQTNSMSIGYPFPSLGVVLPTT